LIRKDFIQRYFDELANVLAVVMNLKNNLKPVEAEAKISDFANDFLKISFEEILAIETDLIEFLKEEKAFTFDHFKILEDLLYHKYLLNPTDTYLKKNTLEVLNYVSKNDTNYSFERMSRLKELDSK
tara:strand:+ start:8964 stop:9344 length:381 start_codon:yes stop_codon:yes gene_type:complete